MSILSNLRDKAVESFVRKNELVQKFGEVQSVAIDSDNGTADVSILLHGEASPIKFRGYYSFEDGESGTDIVVRKITCEREWIDTALSMYVNGKNYRYTLPGLAGSIAKIVF